MKRLILWAGFLTLVFVGTATAQRKCRPPRHAKVPKVTGQTYDRARHNLIAAGWRPYKTNTESTAETNLRFGNGPLYWREKHYIEVTACGGTNPGCEFIFKDKFDNKLYVDTYGLEDPAKRTHAKVTSTRIYCDWELD